MIKWCAKLFSILLTLIKNNKWVASLSGGLNNVANVMIISNLAAKEPFVKFGDVVLFVPKKLVGVASYVVSFLKKTPAVTVPALALLAYGIWRAYKSSLVKEGINNAYEFVQNLFFFNGSDDDSSKLLIDEVGKINENSFDGYVSSSNINAQNSVTFSFYDFDKSGEVTHTEFVKGERLTRAVRRLDPDLLYVLQCVTEDNIDFVELLKRSRRYTYERI